MSSTQVFRTTLFLYAPQVLNPVVSTVLVLLIARARGTEGIAEYTLAIAFLYMGQALATLGLTVPIARTVAVARSKAVACLNTAAVMGLAASAAAILAGHLLLAWLAYEEGLHQILVFALWGVVPSVLVAICEAIFVPLDKAHYVAAAAFTENLIKVVGGALLLLYGHGIFSVCVLIVALRLLTCCVELLALRSTCGRLIAPLDWEVVERFVSLVPVFATSTVVGVLVLRADVILLSKVAGVADVGLYSAAARLVFLVLPLGAAFAQAILPPMSQYRVASRIAFDEISQKSVRYVGIVGAVATFGLYLFAAPIVSTLYGADFAESTSILMIMSLGIIPALLSTVYGSILFASHNEAYDLKAKVVKLLLLFGLIAALCPGLGALGMATAWSLAQIGHVATQCTLLMRRELPAGRARSLWRPACALFGGLAVFSLSGSLLDPLGYVAASATFVLLLAALTTLSEDEKQALRALPGDLLHWSRRTLLDTDKS